MRYVIALGLTMAAAQLAMPATDFPKCIGGQEGRRVLDRSIEALGGRSALEALTSYRLTGEMEGLSGFPGTYTLVAVHPDSRRVDWDIRYISQIRSYDRREGWERNASVREIVGDELRRLARDSAFLPVHTRLLDLARKSACLTRSVDGESYIVHFAGPRGAEQIDIDAKSFLPVRERRYELYEEGPVEISVTYGDYRLIRNVRLPFLIDERRPDLSFRVRVDGYEANPRIEPSFFANPNRSHAHERYQLSLHTIPLRVFKERVNIWGGELRRFWGMPYPDSEAWTLDFVVDEKYGRYVQPRSATLRLYAGNRLVKSETFPREALEQLRRFPVTRFSPRAQIYNFRHNFREPVPQKIDRIEYTFIATTPSGDEVSQSIAVPLEAYESKNRLIFPVRGNFIVINGHEDYELDHKYEWSQHYALDIVGLGPDLQLLNPDGSFYAFGRTEIIAPADGVVTYARNDVPDGKVKSDYLKMHDGKWAIGGNIVMLAHPHGEYSLLAHMREGSVRVKKGDRVRQGELIGLMGASGSPGHPHLHYQLQSTPELFEGDGLPARFENVQPTAWFEGEKVNSIKRGVYLKAQ